MSDMQQVWQGSALRKVCSGTSPVPKRRSPAPRRAKCSTAIARAIRARSYILDEHGEPRPHVVVFIGEERARDRPGQVPHPLGRTRDRRRSLVFLRQRRLGVYRRLRTMCYPFSASRNTIDLLNVFRIGQVLAASRSAFR
jgi:hypothetical protein